MNKKENKHNKNQVDGSSISSGNDMNIGDRNTNSHNKLFVLNVGSFPYWLSILAILVFLGYIYDVSQFFKEEGKTEYITTQDSIEKAPIKTYPNIAKIDKKIKVAPKKSIIKQVNPLLALKINCSQNEIQNIINNHLVTHLKNNRIKFTTNTQLKTITHELVINVKMTKQKKEVGVLPLFLVKFNINGNLTNRKNGEHLNNFNQNSELFNTTDETKIPQKFDEWLPTIDSQFSELFQEMKSQLKLS